MRNKTHLFKDFPQELSGIQHPEVVLHHFFEIFSKHTSKNVPVTQLHPGTIL
jgi:hypothetical protein